MAATITFAGDWLENVGALTRTQGTLTLGTYATGGVSVTPANLGLGSFNGSPMFSAAGYAFTYDATNSKVLAYRSGGFTPLGSVAAPTITSGTSATITTPLYTNGGAITQVAGAAGITGVQAPAFTGIAIPASPFVEVGNAVDLSAVTVSWTALGK